MYKIDYIVKTKVNGTWVEKAGSCHQFASYEDMADNEDMYPEPSVVKKVNEIFKIRAMDCDRLTMKELDPEIKLNKEIAVKTKDADEDTRRQVADILKVKYQPKAT